MSFRILFVFLLILVATPKSVLAYTWVTHELEVCNKGRITIYVARAAAGLSSLGGVTYWRDGKVEGWFEFKPGQCRDLSTSEPGSYYLSFRYKAADGRSGGLSFDIYSETGARHTDKKFLINYKREKFQSGWESDLGDVPSHLDDGAWIMGRFPLRFSSDYDSWNLNQGITIRPTVENNFCPYDENKCYKIRDYEAKARRGENNTRNSSTESSKERGTGAGSTGTPPESDEEARQKKRETEYRAKRYRQRRKCTEAGWCDVWEDPYMLRPYGEANWYDVNGREISESKWPDLPVRNEVLQKDVPWVSQLNSELGSSSCARTTHIEAPVHFDAANESFDYLNSQRGGLLSPTRYHSFGIALKSVYLENTLRKSGKCWEIALRCTKLECITKRSAISTASQGPKAFMVSTASLDLLRLKFETKASAEAASKALSEVLGDAQSKASAEAASNTLSEKSDDVPLQRRFQRFAYSLIVGLFIAIVALAVPLVIAGLIAPRFFYPFAKPSRWKWLLFALLYLLGVIVVVLLIGAGVGATKISGPVSAIGLVLGLIVVITPTAVGRIKKTKLISKSPDQLGSV